jgi:hypothetical protein
MLVIFGIPAVLGTISFLVDKKRGVTPRPIDAQEYHMHTYLPQNYWYSK